MKNKLFIKINVSEIVKNHFITLVDAVTHKPGKDDYYTFLGLPVVVAATLTLFKVSISPAATSIIITSLAIFVGLLINMVVLLFDLLRREGKSETKIRILKQLFANILFTILLSIILILLSLIGLFPVDINTSKCIVDVLLGLDCLIYFLLSFLFLTLLMVLKRMYALFNHEIKEIEKMENIKNQTEVDS